MIRWLAIADRNLISPFLAGDSCFCALGAPPFTGMTRSRRFGCLSCGSPHDLDCFHLEFDFGSAVFESFNGKLQDFRFVHGPVPAEPDMPSSFNGMLRTFEA